MFFLFSHYCLCYKGEAEDEEHSKSPLFLMLTCSLRDKSSHTQPMTPVSINMLPLCLGNDYSGFQLKHWLSILGPVHTNPDIVETVYLFSPVFMWTGLRATLKRGFTFMGFRWASSLFSRGRKADPGEGPGRPAPPPLFVDQIEAWRAKNQFFGDRASPYLGGWMTAPPLLFPGSATVMCIFVVYFSTSLRSNDHLIRNTD